MILHLKMHIIKHDDIYIMPKYLNFYLTKPVFFYYNTFKIYSITVDKMNLKRFLKIQKYSQKFIDLQL